LTHSASLRGATQNRAWRTSPASSPERGRPTVPLRGREVRAKRAGGLGFSVGGARPRACQVLLHQLDGEGKDEARVTAIAEAAKAPVELRDAWLNPLGARAAELKGRTLTNLYNARPTWLELAHQRLDEVVLDAYGWPREVSDEEILGRLLRLNGERAGKGGGDPQHPTGAQFPSPLKETS